MDLSQPPSGFPPTLDTRDAESCLAAVSKLAAINVAHSQLLRLLSSIQRRPPLASGYLKVLESVHATLANAQGGLTSHHAAKPLPPSEAEMASFRSMVSLWRQMAQGYAQIAQLGDPSIENCLALICQRCLLYSGRVLIEYFRTRRTPAPVLWADLHGYYRTAEERGLAHLQVPDAASGANRFTTCADTYAAVLLIDLADTYGRSPRELSWIVHWCEHLAPLTTIAKAGMPDNAYAYSINLMQDRGLRPADNLASSEYLRYLDTARLAPYLQLALTRQQVLPAKLGLGPDCKKPAAGRLVLQLHRRLAVTPRRYERCVASGTLSVCCGFTAIYYSVRGGELADQGNGFSPDKMEHWQIADQSLNGLRLLRGPAGRRIEPAELLGIKLPDSEHFLLAKIIWLTLELDDRVHAGLQLLPGRPQAIRVSATGIMSADEYLHAFLLPAVPALGKQSSLVLPRGLFPIGSTIEIDTGHPQHVRLTRQLRRGSDFEQIAFAAA